MKKLVLALLVGIAVFATASVAAAEITVGGEIEMRYDLWYNLGINKDFNLSNSDGSRTLTQTFFADRILLNVDAKITEGLEAFVELDTLDSERVWGVNNSQGHVFSAVNYQSSDVRVKQAWVNFMVPGIPVGVKIGHQPLALGHGISLDTHRSGTDAILVYSKPIDQLLIAGVYAKVVEGSSSAPGTGNPNIWNPLFTSGAPSAGLTGHEHNDADVWAALANYTFMPGNTVGVNYLFVHDNSLGNTFNSRAVIHLHNIGITADGVIGPISYKAEYDFQDMNIAGNGLFGDTKTHGVNHSHAAMVGVGAKVGPANVGMEVAYGSGSNFQDDFAHGRGAFVLTGNAYDTSKCYHSPYGETSYNYAFLYNDKIGQGPMGGGGGLGFGDGTGGFGLANTGYIKLTAGINPTDKLGIDMAVLYLRASEPFFRAQSRDLGWEVDAHAGYKIYDNLNLDVTGGVFVPGAWYSKLDLPPGSIGHGMVDIADGDSYVKRNPAYGLETKLTCKF